jgi:hypothetical protein
MIRAIEVLSNQDKKLILENFLPAANKEEDTN